MDVYNPDITMKPNAATEASILGTRRHIKHPTKMATKNGADDNNNVFRVKYTTLKNPRSP